MCCRRARSTAVTTRRPVGASWWRAPTMRSIRARWASSTRSSRLPRGLPDRRRIHGGGRDRGAPARRHIHGTRAKGRDLLVIPVVSVLFATGGVVENMQEEIIPLIPVLLILTRRLGFTPMVAVAMSAGAAFVGSGLQSHQSLPGVDRATAGGAAAGVRGGLSDRLPADRARVLDRHDDALRGGAPAAGPKMSPTRWRKACGLRISGSSCSSA